LFRIVGGIAHTAGQELGVNLIDQKKKRGTGLGRGGEADFKVGTKNRALAGSVRLAHGGGANDKKASKRKKNWRRTRCTEKVAAAKKGTSKGVAERGGVCRVMISALQKGSKSAPQGPKGKNIKRISGRWIVGWGNVRGSLLGPSESIQLTEQPHRKGEGFWEKQIRRRTGWCVNVN